MGAATADPAAASTVSTDAALAGLADLGRGAKRPRSRARFGAAWRRPRRSHCGFGRRWSPPVAVGIADAGSNVMALQMMAVISVRAETLEPWGGAFRLTPPSSTRRGAGRGAWRERRPSAGALVERWSTTRGNRRSGSKQRAEDLLNRLRNKTYKARKQEQAEQIEESKELLFYC